MKVEEYAHIKSLLYNEPTLCENQLHFRVRIDDIWVYEFNQSWGAIM